MGQGGSIYKGWGGQKTQTPGGWQSMNPYQQSARAQGTAMAGTMAAGQNVAAGPQGHTVGMPATIRSGMSTYTNPWETQVVNRTADQMTRARNEALMMNEARAAQAGAFGGGRHGLTDAVTMTDTTRAIGDMTAQLRAQGFNTAADLSGRDIANRTQAEQFNAGQNYNTWRDKTAGMMQTAAQLGTMGRQSFNYGTTMDDRMMEQGGMGQDMQQGLIGQGAGMFDRYTGSPQDMLSMLLSSLGMNPLTRTGTQTSEAGYNPGFYDWLALGLNSIPRR